MIMKNLILIFSIIGILAWQSPPVSAKMAKKDDIDRLKKHLVEEQVILNVTTLNDIRNKYGDAVSIKHTENGCSYNYGDLTLDFLKKEVLTDWEYSTKQFSIDSEIRKELNEKLNKTILKNYTTMNEIIADYGEPSAREFSEKDPSTTILYYGNIKLTFKEKSILSSWTGKGLPSTSGQGTKGVLTSLPAEEKK